MGDIPNLSNLTALATSVPLMTRENFARLVGVTAGTVDGWVDRGYIPTLAVGKYSLVNVALLNKRALEREFS